MTLENRVLASLAEQARSARRHEFHVADADGGWNLYATVERRDELSCLVWEFTLRRAEAAPVDIGRWADEVAQRTQALSERLTVYEVDPTRGEALLRSDPVERLGQRLYFEVHLAGARNISVRRILAPQQAGQRREQVAFAVTNETLARLVADLAGA